MSNQQQRVTTYQGGSARDVIAGHSVLRNTYMLLGLTLFFSGLVAFMSMSFNWPYPGPIVTLVGYFALLFLTSATRNSGWGIVSVFALTGFMGYTLGPILNIYLHMYVNAGELIMMSLGGTGLIFFGLSAYVLMTQKDFSFLTGFIMVGALVAFVSIIAAIFLQIPALHLAISAFMMVLASLMILWQTSAIIHGGETNYIMATITLYVSLYNLFMSLLQLLAHFAGDRN